MMKIRARYVAALVTAGLVGCGGVGGTAGDNGEVAEELTVPSAVANMVPSGVVESTGNLYWTRNVMTGGIGSPLRWTGSVYRAGKNNVPGQETVLYSEGGNALGSSFGSITFANVNGVWYGYFLASYRYSGTYLKRVPLDGSSPAVTLGGVTPASSNSQLVTDGMYLYFWGANGLYAAPMDGGPALTVAQTTGINSLGIDRAHIYYSAGSQLLIALKPNYGSFSRVSETFSEPIAAIYVNAGADNDDTLTSIAIGTTHSIILWTQSPGHSPGLTTLATNPYDTINSVSMVGTRVLWTSTYSAANSSWVNYHDATQGANQYHYLQVQTGARSIMGDASNMYFVDNYAFERLAY